MAKYVPFVKPESLYSRVFQEMEYLFERNSKPKYPKPPNSCSKCATKNVITDAQTGEKVCFNDKCKSSGTVLGREFGRSKDIREMTQSDRDALEISLRALEEDIEGNL